MPESSESSDKKVIYTPKTLQEAISIDDLLSEAEIERQLQALTSLPEEQAADLLYSLTFHIKEAKYAFSKIEHVQVCLQFLQRIADKNMGNKVAQLLLVKISPMLQKCEDREVISVSVLQFIVEHLLSFDILQQLTPYIQHRLEKEERFITPDTIAWIAHLLSQQININVNDIDPIIEILTTCMIGKLYPDNALQSFDIIEISVIINKLLTTGQLVAVKPVIIQLLAQSGEKIGHLKANKQANANWDKVLVMSLLGNIVCYENDEEISALTIVLLKKLLSLPIDSLTFDASPYGSTLIPKPLDRELIEESIEVISKGKEVVLAKIMALQINKTHPIPADLIIDLHLCSYPVATILCQYTLQHFQSEYQNNQQLVIIHGASTGSKDDDKGKMKKIVTEQLKPFEKTLSSNPEKQGLGAMRVSFKMATASSSKADTSDNWRKKTAKTTSNPPSSSYHQQPSYGNPSPYGSSPSTGSYPPPSSAKKTESSAKKSNFFTKSKR